MGEINYAKTNNKNDLILMVKLNYEKLNLHISKSLIKNLLF